MQPLTYDWDFGVLLDPAHIRALAHGVAVTLGLTIGCLVIGTPAGFGVGILASLGRELPGFEGNQGGHTGPDPIGMRQACLRLTAAATIIAVDSVRAVPLLLLMLISYYGLPVALSSIAELAGKPTPVQVSSVACALAAMSVNLAAFVADLVRGAVNGASRGGIVAARALGMTRAMIWRFVILPDVAREIFPGLTLLAITMLKMSTLASVLTVYETLHVSDQIIQETYRPLELYVGACVIFIGLVLPIGFLARRLESS